MSYDSLVCSMIITAQSCIRKCKKVKFRNFRCISTNLCFNTFIRYTADQKFQQFGFTLNSLKSTHWFLFSDDAAVITGRERENQMCNENSVVMCVEL